LKVVLDTNVLVAALLKKGKAYRLLQRGLRNDRFLRVLLDPNP
jgi:predicted nucleic acid-binding protein